MNLDHPFKAAEPKCIHCGYPERYHGEEGRKMRAELQGELPTI